MKLIWDSTLPKDLRKQYEMIAERNKTSSLSPKKMKGTGAGETVVCEKASTGDNTTVLLSKECRESMES